MGNRFRTPARVLAEWRAALHRLEATPIGLERKALGDEVEALRHEYQQATAALLEADTRGHVGQDSESVARDVPKDGTISESPSE